MVSSALQALNIDLVHLQHGLHDAAGFGAIRIAQKFAQRGGDDLPGDAELVAQPAAAAFLAAGGELFPQLVNLGLGVAVHKKGYGGSEAELRAAIQGHELLAVDLKRAGHHRSLGAGARVAVAVESLDFGILEDGGVEIHGLFGLAIEPEEGDDFLHGGTLLFD